MMYMSGSNSTYIHAYSLFVYLGSIEIQIATMTKHDRSKVDEVYVCEFIPSYAVPNKMPWAMDPFLDPLITEVEDSFINGKIFVMKYMHVYIKLFKIMYALYLIM